MKKADVESLVNDQLLPAWKSRTDVLDEIDGWINPSDHKKFPLPPQANREHRALQDLSEAPWGGVVVATVAQTLDLESIYSEQADDPAVKALWAPWKRNRMDRGQGPLHRGSIAFGEAYTRVTRGSDGLALINGRSARDAFVGYRDSRDDGAMPMFALEKASNFDMSNALATGHLALWHEDGVRYSLGFEGGAATYIEETAYDYGAVPFIRYAPQLDLEGISRGEIQPLIPVLGRIEKTAYDRIVLQHKSSWKVRTATGLDAQQPGQDLSDEDRMKLAHDDILIGESGVEFGTLDETSVEPMIRAHEADLDVLSALSQTPITALGKFINVSADAIAEARASLYAKRDDYRKTLGISHLDTLRFSAHVEGRYEDAANFDVYSGWADTEVRTMGAAADALGKVATMLQVPAEELWSLLPFVNYTMAEKWKTAARSQKSAKSLAETVARLAGQGGTDAGPARGNAAS